MKIVTLSKEEFDDYSSKHIFNTYFQSSNYADFAKINDQYNAHYLGFVDESGNIIGASLMLYKPLFWGYKYAYAPRGLLINYDDPEMISSVTKSIKKLLKKQKFIFIKINPLIVVSERDKTGKIIKFNNNVNQILETFKENDYEHLGFNIYNESTLPRWNVIAKLNKDGRIMYNYFSPDVKEKISYANNIGLIVEEDPEASVERFFSIVKKTTTKFSKKRLTNLRNAFFESGKIKIFYVKLDTKKYVENANKLYSAEEEKNLELGNIIQSGDSVNYDIQKAVKDKITSDRLLHTYKKDIVTSIKLMKTYPNGIYCGVAVTIEDARGVNIETSFVDNTFIRYSPNTLLVYEIMKYYSKLGFNYINIGAVTGNFDPQSKYYSLLESKLGFNSSILEYIGEFNCIINPTLYKIYKRKYHVVTNEKK